MLFELPASRNVELLPTGFWRIMVIVIAFPGDGLSEVRDRWNLTLR